MDWQRETRDQWVLVVDGTVVRAVIRGRAYFNEPGPDEKWRVSGDGHELSAHDSLAEAQAAAEASL